MKIGLLIRTTFFFLGQQRVLWSVNGEVASALYLVPRAFVASWQACSERDLEAFDRVLCVATGVCIWREFINVFCGSTARAKHWCVPRAKILANVQNVMGFLSPHSRNVAARRR